MINIATTNKNKQFSTYKAWKSAVKKIDPKASFSGDEDIDGAFVKGKYDASWDGDSGIIETASTNHMVNVAATTSLLTDLRTVFPSAISISAADKKGTYSVEFQAPEENVRMSKEIDQGKHDTKDLTIRVFSSTGAELTIQVN